MVKNGITDHYINNFRVFLNEIVRLLLPPECVHKRTRTRLSVFAEVNQE